MRHGLIWDSIEARKRARRLIVEYHHGDSVAFVAQEYGPVCAPPFFCSVRVVIPAEEARCLADALMDAHPRPSRRWLRPILAAIRWLREG